MQYTAQELLEMVSIADDTTRVMENIRATMEKLAKSGGDQQVYDEILESLFTMPRVDALLLVSAMSVVAQRDDVWPGFMTSIEKHARKRTH